MAYSHCTGMEPGPEEYLRQNWGYLPPSPSQMRRGYPKVPTPQARYLLPWARSDRGYPKVSTPQPRYLPPPAKVPTHPTMSDGGTSRYLPPTAKVPTPRTGQHMEYLICHSRYVSCVHAGGLSCYNKRMPFRYQATNALMAVIILRALKTKIKFSGFLSAPRI